MSDDWNTCRTAAEYAVVQQRRAAYYHMTRVLALASVEARQGFSGAAEEFLAEAIGWASR